MSSGNDSITTRLRSRRLSCGRAQTVPSTMSVLLRRSFFRLLASLALKNVRKRRLQRAQGAHCALHEPCRSLRVSVAEAAGRPFTHSPHYLQPGLVPLLAFISRDAVRTTVPDTVEAKRLRMIHADYGSELGEVWHMHYIHHMHPLICRVIGMRPCAAPNAPIPCGCG